MKHIRTFENYRIKKNREELIKEAVLQVNDIYKVKTMIDIPQSLINAYVKKVKDTTGKNLRQFFGDVDIAEEIVKYINLNNLNIDNIPGGALMGGQAQSQSQSQVQDNYGDEGQAQVQTEPQAQPQTQGEGQAQVQTEPQAQPQTQGEFEEPQAQGQAQPQAQGQAQPQAQGQAQPQAQGQAQPQAQGQAQGQAEVEAQEGLEEVQGEEEGEEDLPI
jgi:hypothetical protein